MSCANAPLRASDVRRQDAWLALSYLDWVALLQLGTVLGTFGHGQPEMFCHANSAPDKISADDSQQGDAAGGVPTERGFPCGLLPRLPTLVPDPGQLYVKSRPLNMDPWSLGVLTIAALLITYGRLTQEALCEGIITKTLKPLETQLDSIPAKTLLVRYKEMIVWSIPLEQCQTWFVRACHALSAASSLC